MNGSTYNASDLSIARLFDKALEAFKANALIIVAANLIVIVITSLAGGSTMGLATLLVYGPLMAGYYWLALQMVRGERADLSALLAPFQRDPVQTILLGALLLVFYAIGFVLCIIPGFIAVLLYLAAFFYYVDKRMPAWDAMEASRKMISRDWTTWLLLLVVLAGINLVGALFCGVGLLITKPFSALMIAAAYDAVEPAVLEARPYTPEE